MPTYQYTCTDCGDRLEVVQKFTDDALTVCPACQGRLRKVYSAVGVVFKGSGFYRTDSRAAGNGSSSKSKETSGETSKDTSKDTSAGASDESSSGTSKDGSSNGKADASTAKSSTGSTTTS